MALARDPHTLFISWDFSPATLARAKDGLDSPRPVLRVYEGDRVVRVEEFAIESRSFYIHGLPPGRSYRVEAHFVGRDGRSRRIGPSTHPVVLPHDGLSEDTMVRFMRMPPPPPPTVIVAPQPVVAPPEPTQETLFEEREFITWNRVPLPGSADVAAVLERRRDRIQREASPAGPEAPGGALPPHLEVSARPLGSSELSVARGQHLGGASELLVARGQHLGGASELLAARGQHLGGASELLAARGQHLGGASELLAARGQHLGGASELLAARGQHLGGASELAAARGLRFGGASEHSADRGRGGASEQIHWTPPPSGRGR
jgi:hypothetical protein